MIRAGLGEPLVLLNGIGGGPTYWREVMPLLAPHVDTIALCTLGHRGGPTPTDRPVTFRDVVDDAERQLDALGLGTVHVAGCSLGGLMTLELVRRGRARSAVAFSPGGMWRDEAQRLRVVELLESADRENRLGWPLRKLTTRSKRLRRYGLRTACEHGDRLTREHVLDFAADWQECTVLHELLEDPWQFPVLDALPCPVTVAWAEKDLVLPLETDGAHARALIPGAEHIVLEGLGHVAMLDDPQRVSDTILRVVAAASAPAAVPVAAALA